MRLRSMLPLAALLAAGSAQAAGLTGTWVGQWKCTSFNGEKFEASSDKDDPMRITQAMNRLAIDLDGTPFSGVVISDDRKPESHGEVAASNCDTDANPAAGSDELARLRFAVDGASGKGTLKGTSVYLDGGDTAGTCKWSYKRISTANPGVPLCP